MNKNILKVMKYKKINDNSLSDFLKEKYVYIYHTSFFLNSDMITNFKESTKTFQFNISYEINCRRKLFKITFTIYIFLI